MVRTLSLPRVVWVAAFLALSGPAAAECAVAPEASLFASPEAEGDAEAAVGGPTTSDAEGRVVAPISVNGRGPYRFIVDTGANRSAIAEALAAQLGLTSSGAGQVHSVYGVNEAPLVEVEGLHYADVSLRGEVMPVLRPDVLAGEHGLLGVDGMRGRQLRIDFERNCIDIVPSRRTGPIQSRWMALGGEMRFGHLVIVEGEISGVEVKVFLDTGSNQTLANLALYDALDARVGRPRTVEQSIVAYSAGRPVVLDRGVVIPRMTLGPLEVRDVTAYVGDFHIFDVWGLSQEPTLLVGMDVLSQAAGLAIDYGRGRVYLRVREDAAPARTGSRLGN